jgi:hypothetical protein
MIKHCMTKLGSRDINFGFRLFDSMVALIVYYGAEIWGTDKVKDIPMIIHLQFGFSQFISFREEDL